MVLFAHRSESNLRMLVVRGKNMTQVDMVAVDELVREIARALVDEPTAVEVESVAKDENTILRLRVIAMK